MLANETVAQFETRVDNLLQNLWAILNVDGGVQRNPREWKASRVIENFRNAEKQAKYAAK